MSKIVLTVLLLISCISGFSQKWKLTRYEAMAGIGTANYFGSIGGSSGTNNWFGLKDIDILGTRPSFYGAARYKIQQDQALKFNLVFGWLSASDKGSKNQARGYSFNTYFSEQSIQLEYSFLKEDSRRTSYALFNRRGMMNNYSKFGGYFFGGVGGIFYKPVFNGTKYADGDVINTSAGYALIIPAGIGFKMIYNNYYALGIEFGGRYTFSKYLDGFNNVLYSKAKDLYYFGDIHIIYRIKTSRKGFPIIFSRYRY
jgi:hypothetical protein